MNKINDAIGRIKALECPTGDLETRVLEILEDYKVADKNKINIDKNDDFNTDDEQVYSVKIAGENKSIVVVSKLGCDDYVEKVVDVYSK